MILCRTVRHEYDDHVRVFDVRDIWLGDEFLACEVRDSEGTWWPYPEGGRIPVVTRFEAVEAV